MKRGFTLVEIIATIILLGVMGLLVTPIISNTIKENKENLYKDQLKEIEAAAEKWAYENMDMLPSSEGDSVTINLLQLKQGGYLNLDIRDPRDGELLSNTETTVKITLISNNYHYAAISKTDNLTTEVNNKAPIIVLNGDVLEYVEINSEYQEKGIIAKDQFGNILTDVSIQYKKNNGTEVSSINTSDFNTYTIIYSTISNNESATVTRTVIVRDTTPPELTIPGELKITSSQATSYDYLQDITYSDNSLKTVNVTVSDTKTTVGEHFITYKAVDPSGNETIKRRKVIITN